LTPQRRKALRCFRFWARLSHAAAGAAFGEYRLDLIVGAEVASIGLLDALADVTNMV
jgi:hypothetical protein